VYKAPYAAAARFPAASEAVVTRFTTLPKPARADYLALAGYVVEGFLTYATPTNARARYPGLHAGGKRQACHDTHDCHPRPFSRPLRGTFLR